MRRGSRRSSTATSATCAASCPVLETDAWLFFLRRDPPLGAGQGSVVLRRHCESPGALTDAELRSLCPVLATVERLSMRVLGARRVHVGLYGEKVRHVHLHVLPRTDALPAGSVPATLLGAWRTLLRRLGLRRPVPDAGVSRVDTLVVIRATSRNDAGPRRSPGRR